MAKITIDWGGTVQIKEQYEVPYEVAKAIDVLIEKYHKRRYIEGNRIVVEVRDIKEK